MTLRLRVSARAEADIVDILSWSQAQFGEAARRRYETLIATALLDISVEIERPGSTPRPELGDGVRSWHLMLSRDRATDADGRVQRPRHFLLYRVDGDRVVVGRVLHDAMELDRHLRAIGSWE